MNEDVAQLTPRLRAALEYAFLLYRDDARRGSNTPVLAHLLGVCALVQGDGGDEDEAIAALLHDALEDKPERTSRDELGARFGERVLALVATATDTPPEWTGGEKPPWRERKEGYLRRARRAEPGLLRVTIADKVDNLRAMLAEYRRLGERLWERFNAGRDHQVWYYRSALEAYRAAGARGPLLDELARLVRELEAAVSG